MPKPTVTLVSCTQSPVETIVASWFNSRDTGPVWTAENLKGRLMYAGRFPADGHGAPSDGTIFQRLLKDKATESWQSDLVTMFYEICQMDIPILEFVTLQLSFDSVPRAFVDQLDRTRTAAFWEQSVRVLDLSKMAEQQQYFVPDEIANNGMMLAEYEAGMSRVEEMYNNLLGLGCRPELARGIVPMHINVRADASISLRTLVQMVRKRSCFFAQGSYWTDLISQLLEILVDLFPDPEKTRAMFSRLPCDLEINEFKCPYKRDIMDRLVDRSNPICPILYTRELDVTERDATDVGMEKMYGMPRFVEMGRSYLNAIRPSLEPQFVDLTSS